MPDMERSAVISECKKYRYSLTRTWYTSLPTVVFIGLNPSTADATEDDATIRKCIGFAERWEYGRLIMLNLFAFRATNPADMKAASDPIGPENNNVLHRMTKVFDVIVCWGCDGDFRDRAWVALNGVINGIPKCLGKTKHCHPKHPLYLPYETERELYRERL